MKKVFIFCIILQSIINSAFTQSGFAKYQLNPTENNPYVFFTTYEVYFDKNKALIIPSDSVDKILINEKYYKKVHFAPYAKAICDYKTDSCTLYKNDGKNKLHTAKELYPAKWEFDSIETKEINGYLCKKAVRYFWGNGVKETIIAWYCPEITTSANPYTAQGLPGLMFEQETKDGVTKLTELTLKSIDASYFFIIPYSKKVSPEKYFGTKSQTVLMHEKSVKATNAEINKN